ncbi:MAG: hypothetical protein DRQ01_08715 [Ignavibacteriae bacterium]|jgi:hypothetical protein|nr:MAG: hypothetical protein DRQ01_08715 [Ignavibacteriota bacterium]
MNPHIIGIFEEEEELISALNIIRNKNIEITEVFTPYPIHEVIKIMKRKTKLQIATFLYAAFGLVLSYVFIYWTSVISYPLTYGGKPYHAIPSFIIICFVTTICVAILLSVITFFIRSRLYPGKTPTIIDHRITDNAFVILINIQPETPSDEIKTINSLLMKNGAVEVIEK